MSGMDLIGFHKLRTAVQDNAWRGSAEDVLAVERKLWSALVSTGVFADVEVDRTDDPDRLVIAMCRYPFQLSAEAAAETLERVWVDRLRYDLWEAHTLIVARGQVELEAASRSGSDGHFVTLHVLAQQSPFPAQRTPYPSERPTAAPAR